MEVIIKKTGEGFLKLATEGRLKEKKGLRTNVLTAHIERRTERRLCVKK